MTSIETPTPAPFTVSVVPDGAEVAVVPSGELDLLSAGALAERVRAVGGNGSDRVVIDLRRLTFIDSSGLHALLGLRDDARRGRHSLTLVPGPAPVQRVFEISGTRALFDWRDAEPDRVKATTGIEPV
jgi:anti-sigma B factor antagonist